LFAKWNPKNHYFIFFFLHFFSFVSANLHHYPAFGQGLSCILSCISPKKSPFLLQNGRFFFFSYLHYFLVSGQYFRYKHRPKSADKPACISLGYHHIAFSKINSKCFRTGDCRVGSTPTICAISAVESKDFTADIFVYGFET